MLMLVTLTIAETMEFEDHSLWPALMTLGLDARALSPHSCARRGEMGERKRAA